MARHMLWRVAGAIVIATSALLLGLGLYGIGVLPIATILERGPELAVSPRFLRVIATTFVLFGSMYVAGYAIWQGRRWGRIVFLVALPIYFLIGFLPGMRQPAIYWLSIVVLSFAFAMLLVPAKSSEPAPSTATMPSRDSGPAVGVLAAGAAVALLGLAIAFRHIGHPLAIGGAIALSATLVALLVLCRWRPWNRLIGIVLVASAACDLLAVFALGMVDLARLPPFARIPILATSGFLYRAALGAPLDVLVAGFMEGAVPGAAALFVLGIPFLLSPPRFAASARAGRLEHHAVPILASATGVALAIPIVIQMIASPPLPTRGPAIDRISSERVPDATQRLPPPPPPRPPRPSIGPEGPIGSGTVAPGIAPSVGGAEDRAKVATARPRLTVAFSSLTPIKKVEPKYPPAAKAAGRSGTAMLIVKIDRDGNVAAVWNTPPNDEFSEAAKEALQQWRFAPYVLGGEARDVEAPVSIPFKAN